MVLIFIEVLKSVLYINFNIVNCYRSIFSSLQSEMKSNKQVGIFSNKIKHQAQVFIKKEF
jgi:hypothetical protein